MFYGRKMTVVELLATILEDRVFYQKSGGGVTLSGGEPLMQTDFCVELLKQLKAKNIHTAVDTSGFASREKFARLMPYTDLFLFDIKHSLFSRIYGLIRVQEVCRAYDRAQFPAQERI